MPALVTPRISPVLSVMPVPGMKLPGGANTPFMPVRAFGAPHTTETMPSPVSTVHARRRSALGCCTASITCAMRNGASLSPGVSTPSTSSPIAESVSVMRASGASVSRCVFSQDSVNFILSSRSLVQDVRRERVEPVMTEPAQVALVERAQIGDAVLQHRHALDPHAEGEALPLARIDPAIGEHLRVHHPAAEDLEPVAAAAEFARLAVPADIDLHRGLGEGEIA